MKMNASKDIDERNMPEPYHTEDKKSKKHPYFSISGSQ